MGVNVNIQKETTLRLDPPEVLVVMEALMALPYKQVRPLMDKLENQLMLQHGGLVNGPGADQSAAPN